MVYDDAEVLYGEVRKESEALIEEAFEALFQSSSPLSPTAKVSSGNLVAWNTTPFARRDVVKVPLSSSTKLKSKVVQTSKDGKEGYALMDCSEGGSLAFASGLFADCNPASGMLYLATPFSRSNCHLGSVYQWRRSFRAEEFERAAHDFGGSNHQPS